MSDEIREGKSLVALLLEVIGSPKAGLEVVEAAGELVAESARFNKWVLTRKSCSSSADIWNLAALARDHEEVLSGTWNAYHSAVDEARDQKCRELIEMIYSHRDSLRASRESDSVFYRDTSMPQELLDW